jgi:hypothetical protein
VVAQPESQNSALANENIQLHLQTFEFESEYTNQDTGYLAQLQLNINSTNKQTNPNAIPTNSNSQYRYIMA